MAKKQNEEDQDLTVIDYMDKIADWAEKNAGRLISGFLIFSVFVVGVWGFNAFHERSLNKAANAAGLLNRQIDLLEKAISKVSEKDKENAEFKDNKASEIKKLTASVSQLLKSHSTNTVSDFTVVKWASFLVKEDKKDQALEVLNQAKPSGTRELSASVLIMKASLLAEKDKVEEAMTVYDEVLAESRWSLFHSEALIQKGALQSSAGDMEAAMESFTRAKEKAKDSSFSRDASKYLRFLKIKKAQPSDAVKSEG